MAKVELYGNDYCNECKLAEKLLASLASEGAPDLKVLRVDEDEYLFIEMIGRSDRLSVPQIFINDQFIGGYDDLLKLHKKGELKPLLADK